MGMYMQFRRISDDELTYLRTDPDQLEDFFEGNNSLSIDKSWDAINHLLTNIASKSDSSLENVILSGNLLTDEYDERYDFGYGPATYVNKKEVKQLSEQLKLIDINQLENTFTFSLLANNNIYLFSDSDNIENEDEDKDYIFSNFRNLVAFFQEAAIENQLVVKILS